jgi:hypothetical protein
MPSQVTPDTTDFKVRNWRTGSSDESLKHPMKAVSHSARTGLICLAIAWGVMLYKWGTNTIPPTHFQLTRIIQAAPRRLRKPTQLTLPRDEPAFIIVALGNDETNGIDFGRAKRRRAYTQSASHKKTGAPLKPCQPRSCPATSASRPH